MDCPTLSRSKAAMLHEFYKGSTQWPPGAFDVEQMAGMWFFNHPVNGTRVYDERQFVLPGFDPRDPLEGVAGNWNGTTSIAQIADNAAIQNLWDGGGWFCATIYVRSDGENSQGKIAEKRAPGNGWVFDTRNEVAGSTCALYLLVDFSGADMAATTANTLVPLFQPVRVWVEYNSSDAANDPTFYVYYAGVTATQTVVGGAAGTRLSDAGNDLYIGNRNGADRTFDGLMWDVCAGKGILSADQRERIINRARVGAEVFEMPFCEGSGNVGYETSSARNHAALTDVTYEYHRLWFWPGLKAHNAWPNRWGYRLNGAVVIPAEQGTRLAADGSALDYEGRAPVDLVASGVGLDGDRRWIVTAPETTIALPGVVPEIAAVDNLGKWVRWGEGADIVTNGEFAADTDWNKGVGWSIGGGNASCDGTQVADSDLSQDVSAVYGRRYRVIFTVSGYVAGNVTPVIGGTEGTDRSANGTYTEDIICGNTNTDVAIRADLNFVGDIDDVFVYPLQTLVNDIILPSQLLVDGDMEAAGVGDWTPANNAVLTKQTSNPHSGSRVLRNARSITDNPRAQQNILTVDSIYHVFGYARSDGNATPRLRNGGVLWDGTNNTAWQYFDVIFVAASAVFELQSQTAVPGQYTEWDDVRIEEVLAVDRRAVRANWGNMFFGDMSNFPRTAAAQTGYVYHMLAYKEPLT